MVPTVGNAKLVEGLCVKGPVAELEKATYPEEESAATKSTASAPAWVV
jgi:hypothetical protein